MARVTVEDCVLRVPNRFDLVMLAAQRARDIAAGAPLTVERDDDKNPVVSLREIAEKTVGLEELNDALIQGLQKHVEIDEPEEDQADFEMSIVDLTAETGADLAVEEAELAEEPAEEGLAESGGAPDPEDSKDAET